MKQKFTIIACLALCAFSITANAAQPPTDQPAKIELASDPSEYARALSEFTNPAPYVIVLKAPAIVPDLLTVFKLAVPVQHVTVESTASLESRPAFYNPCDSPRPYSLLDVSHGMSESDTFKLQLDSNSNAIYGAIFFMAAAKNEVR